ncbi:uncharacterized protein M421DRAFT_415759 [Didymella exigua CBS 183.55]|uniref:Peptidase A1 domain-containing protein n=1 Tax=Didymella exigua CBS 183.55 TaxID=1150837 RepID=A0A6A5S7C8_9PLEO|nr:uncharacterized protein M421DRAFT_415759 [Didymella exigua CBS 183.55]KAF1933417.1 hypothetical protein M421DRAFT_415759 [Didymella exigua CBS 183.55]
MRAEDYKVPMPPSEEAAMSTSSTPHRRIWRSSTLFHRILVVLCIAALYMINSTSRKMSYADADLSQYTESIFIPYIYKFSPKHVPQIQTTIKDADIEMPVDTGSTMTLIGAPILSSVDRSIGTPAHHFFTSSKILYVGRLVELPITFHGEAGSQAIAKVPILVVDKSWTCPWYDPSTPAGRFECPRGPNGEEALVRDTSKITYMGVGFGRNGPKDGMPYASPRVNAFLNIQSINGRMIPPNFMRLGYAISTQGVHLGLTQAVVKGFQFTGLEPGLTHDEDPRDWAMAKMCFSIDGRGRHCGPGLVDTGISQMYIRAEEGFTIPNVTIRNPNLNGRAKMVKRVKPGTRLSIGFPSLEDSAMSYSFAVGDGSQVEPTYVFPETSLRPPYVNTGRNFLWGCSIAFDAADGRFGFRPVDGTSSAHL